MKFTNCHNSVAFLYFSVAVLVTVNGQPTIDDDIHEYDTSELINMVRELRAEQVTSVSRIGKLEHRLAASVDKIASLEGQLAATSTAKPDTSKLSGLNLTVHDCIRLIHTCLHTFVECHRRNLRTSTRGTRTPHFLEWGYRTPTFGRMTKNNSDFPSSSAHVSPYNIQESVWWLGLCPRNQVGAHIAPTHRAI